MKFPDPTTSIGQMSGAYLRSGIELDTTCCARRIGGSLRKLLFRLFVLAPVMVFPNALLLYYLLHLLLVFVLDLFVGLLFVLSGSHASSISHPLSPRSRILDVLKSGTTGVCDQNAFSGIAFSGIAFSASKVKAAEDRATSTSASGTASTFAATTSKSSTATAYTPSTSTAGPSTVVMPSSSTCSLTPAGPSKTPVRSHAPTPAAARRT
ncbi:hypothetical protein BD626DRAFT_122711 [Schizophyllum amplum]|uniref:Uncharacterized protein n=1 Tax=Schizophyllum amplum TaxID=97359 RepID=A0A550C7S5_9AGAR|nr:hypothetical protein BD626DRAFT_122711 [Auriculariopsis ampla]